MNGHSIFKYRIYCICGDLEDFVINKCIYEEILASSRLTWREIYHRFLNLNPTISGADIISFDYEEDILDD